jgi:hypothetical protein
VPETTNTLSAGWRILDPTGAPVRGSWRRTRESAIHDHVATGKADTRAEWQRAWRRCYRQGWRCVRFTMPVAGTPDDPGADLDSGPLRTIKPSAGTPSVSRAELRAAARRAAS